MAIETALDIVIAAADSYLEAPDCCNALAAAEVVAAMVGRSSTNLPQEVSDWVARRGDSEAPLQAKATLATQLVLKSSELRDLWDESEESEPWRATVTDLLVRLG